MKSLFVIFGIFSVVNCRAWIDKPRTYTKAKVAVPITRYSWERNGEQECQLVPKRRKRGDICTQRCVNMWDEGCINGQLPGSGGDDDYLNGGFNPGKRCIDMWDEGCVNGQVGGSGGDDDYHNGVFNSGNRCLNMWDEGCVNGQLGGSGGDDDYLNGGFNPGKRSIRGRLAKLRKSHSG